MANKRKEPWARRHIGRRVRLWLDQHGEDLLGAFICTGFAALGACLSAIFALGAFTTDAGLFGGGVFLLIAGGFAAGAVMFASYVVKAARCFIRNRRLSKRRSARREQPAS